jgi:hypothetical protein
VAWLVASDRASQLELNSIRSGQSVEWLYMNRQYKTPTEHSSFPIDIDSSVILTRSIHAFYRVHAIIIVFLDYHPVRRPISMLTQTSQNDPICHPPFSLINLCPSARFHSLSFGIVKDLLIPMRSINHRADRIEIYSTQELSANVSIPIHLLPKPTPLYYLRRRERKVKYLAKSPYQYFSAP